MTRRVRLHGPRRYLLADLGEVSAGQDVEVGAERARLHDAVVALRLVGAAEEDVVSQRGVLDPRLLRDVRHRALRHAETARLSATASNTRNASNASNRVTR